VKQIDNGLEDLVIVLPPVYDDVSGDPIIIKIKPYKNWIYLQDSATILKGEYHYYDLVIIRNKLKYSDNGKTKFTITLENKNTLNAANKVEFVVNIDFEETDILANNFLSSKIKFECIEG
jgi:hypothetical protein